MTEPALTVLTGATGFLGRDVLSRILDRPRGDVLLLSRPWRGRSAGARVESLLDGLGVDHAGRARVMTLEADLERSADLPRRLVEAVGGRRCRLLHGAAAVAFDLPLERARAINVGATRALLDAAASLHGHGLLEQFAYLSTAFVAGARNGVAFEEELDVGQTFSNTYERSKFEAERLVRQYAGELPVRVFRPSIVAGDSRTGATADFKVLYWPLAMLARGAVPCIPGRRTASYDVIPVDYVARALLHILDSAEPFGATYHLSSGRPVPLARILEMTARIFELRRLPPLVPPALFRWLLRPLLALTLRGPARRVMLEQGEVYLPYLCRSLAFDHRAADAALAGSGIEMPQPEAYLERVLRYACDTDFGRRAPSGGVSVAADEDRP